MSRPTYQQQEALADFLTKNPGIAKGILRSTHGKYESKKKWEKISTTINELGGAQKNGKGWAKFWSEKKCALKKKCAMLDEAVANDTDLTPIDKQFVAATGGLQFATGDDREDAMSSFLYKSETRDSLEMNKVDTDETEVESPSSPMQASKTDTVTLHNMRMSTSRASYQQLEALADFLMKNPGIAKGTLRTANGIHTSKKKWNMVSTTINTLGGIKKNGKGWAKFWSDRKCALKKKCALLRQSSIGCPGDEVFNDDNDLTPIDKRFLEAMGGLQFATEDDSEGATSPFPYKSEESLELNKVENEDTDIESPTFPTHAAKTDTVPMSACRPTYQQQEVLANFLVENPDIAKGIRRTAHGKHECKKKWENISTAINAMGGAQRDGKGWAKFWSDKKITLKKKFALLEQSLIKCTSDEALDEIIDISPIEKRFLEAMEGIHFPTEDDDDDTLESLDPLEMLKDETEDAGFESPSSPLQAEETDRVLRRRSGRRRPSTHRQRSPLRSSLSGDNQRQRTRAGGTLLEKDGEQRKEAETVTTVLSQTVAQMGNLTAAIKDMSQATKDGAQSIALALNKIAASIMLLKPRES